MSFARRDDCSTKTDVSAVRAPIANWANGGLDRVGEQDGLVAQELEALAHLAEEAATHVATGSLLAASTRAPSWPRLPRGSSATRTTAGTAIDAMRIAEAPYVAASIQNASGRAEPRNATKSAGQRVADDVGERLADPHRRVRGQEFVVARRSAAGSRRGPAGRRSRST